MKIVLACLNLVLILVTVSSCSKGTVDLRSGDAATLLSTLNADQMVMTRIWKNTSEDDTITVGEGPLKYVGTIVDYTDYYRTYKFDSTSGLDYNNGFVFSGTSFKHKINVYKWDTLPENPADNACDAEKLIREDVPTIGGESKVYARFEEGEFYLAFKESKDENGAEIVGAPCNYTKQKINYKYQRVASSSQAFAVMKKDANHTVATFGNPKYGGKRAEVYPDGGLTVTEGHEPIYIASSENAFAVLKKDGTVATWFNETYCTDANDQNKKNKCGVADDFKTPTPNITNLTAPPDGKEVVALFSNYYAYVALHADGTVSTWGLVAYGGNFHTGGCKPHPRENSIYLSDSNPPEGKKVVTIVSNRYSFTAIKADGSITTWGGDCGGNDKQDHEDDYPDNFGSNYLTSAYPNNIFPTDEEHKNDAPAVGSRVVEVVPSEGAFVAVLEDGRIVSWGDKGHGGSYETHYPSGLLSGFTGGSQIPLHGVTGSSKSFAVLNKDGKLASFGNPAYGGNLTTSIPEGSSTTKRFTRVFPGYMSFSAIGQDGLITTWGDIQTSYNGDATIFGSGNIRKFTPARSGYTVDRDTVKALWVIPTSSANLAVLANGTAIAWGNNSQGGSIKRIYPAGAFDRIGSSDADSIAQVYSNWDSFATVKHDGSLVTWGKILNSDNTPASGSWATVEPSSEKDRKFIDTTRIERIYSTSFAFLALKVDGSFMVWGSKQAGGTIKDHTPGGSLSNYRIDQ